MVFDGLIGSGVWLFQEVSGTIYIVWWDRKDNLLNILGPT